MIDSLKPLTGRHVVSMALNVPGPMAAERLRLFGARVTKIEPPNGDPLRAASPAWYAELTRDTEIETLDLKSAGGREKLLARLGHADLLLTAQRPSALARLGLGWTELHRRFPTLCQVAIVGHAAPHADTPGHDLTYLAANGLAPPPSLPPTLFADVTGSEQAALAALAALMERDRKGVGQYAEVALADAARRLAAPRLAGLTVPGAILGGGHAGYGLYRTKDGWIALAALEARFMRALEQAIGPRAKLADRFLTEPSEYWVNLGQRNDLPIVAVAYTPAT